MIFVGHIQFAVPSFDRAIDFLHRRGFVERFRENGFDSVPLPFFRIPGKTLVFLERDGLCFELINASEHAGPGSYAMVFQPQADLDAVEPLGGVPCRGDAGKALRHVEVQTHSPHESLEFWMDLGFERVSADDPRMLRQASSGMGVDLSLKLVESLSPRGTRRAFVDDLGCSLVSLVSNRPGVLMERIRDRLAHSWPAQRLNINGRLLEIRMIMGPSGELVELVTFVRKKRDAS